MQTITTMAGIAAYIIVGVVFVDHGVQTFTNKTLIDRLIAASITTLAAFALWGLWINTTFGG